ncbi:MAG: glycosyltransferase family 4 protein [Candidatus Bathyarchaeota archaeon]|nr:glycosyltransferase family 4 protein [Candidatus Bathyarchaeota archaeon]
MSKNHNVTVLCVNDNWKLKYDTNYAEFQKSYKDLFNRIKVVYITDLNIPPYLQDVSSLFFLLKLTKHKLNLKQFDLHLNYNGLFTSSLITSLLRVPTVYDVADDLPNMSYTSKQIPQILRGLSYIISKHIFKRNMKNASKITLTTKQISEMYGVPNNKISVIPNGVDYDLFTKAKSFFREKNDLGDSFIVGFVGVLREWLNFEPFLNALAELVPECNMKAVIVGDGPCAAELKQSVSSKSLDSYVQFTGTINYDDIPDIINSFDVGIIPFRFDAVSQNSLPLKLFEYMACEVPVISTPLRSVTALFGQNVFYASSTADYKRLLKRLYFNRQLTKNAGKNGRLVTLHDYSWSNIILRFEKLLVEC